jgi:hypothetical protein
MPREKSLFTLDGSWEGRPIMAVFPMLNVDKQYE